MSFINYYYYYTIQMFWRLLCGHPNPYTFSKSLAEQIVVDYSDQIKAVIVRPSVGKLILNLICTSQCSLKYLWDLEEEVEDKLFQRLVLLANTNCVAVMPAVEEPLPGWVDSLNGMAVLCITNSFGILRVARHSNEAHQDYVGVDLVVKCLFVAAWITTKK